MRDEVRGVDGELPLTEAQLSRYSWHSFRIALACALRALSLKEGDRVCSDSTIQALCRWASAQSLKVYARLSRDDYADLLVQAGKMTFNPVQAATLWAEAPVIDNDDC